ncbi:MAG TPA: single-stranded-DNA-specific exonuclease RecJ, partial [Chromatiaceae bacterium]|nr:single-stranded-DNA-specific exonuclease RecJ [Chromatiaceae bacterium]
LFRSRADAMVNPNLPGNRFPAGSTAGVGVIFYVMLTLRAELRGRGWFKGREEPNLASLLDLVALGTVADLVPLEHNNRILVHQGLLRIAAGRCRPGILALLELAGRKPGRVSAADLGFVVGPRINAAGRLDDISLGIECLLAETIEEARPLAQQLDHHNRDRRRIEEEMKEQALRHLQRLKLSDEDLPWGLCLRDEAWHQGVIGILASRIKEKFQRPVIAFAPGSEGELKGSARSIRGLHIRDALDEVAARSPGLLTRFGGHAMAAGLTLEACRFEEFAERFEEVVRSRLRPQDLQPVILSDGEIEAELLGLDLARQIAEAGPWGQGFPEPLFHGRFEVLNQRLLKEKHWKLVVRPAGGHGVMDAIGFHLADQHPGPLPDRLLLAYRLELNEFRGNINPQLQIVHLEKA